MRGMKALILIAAVLSSLAVHAHPVIYQDGWALSSANMADYSNNYVMYSFSPRLAAGVDHWRFTRNGENNELGLVKLNHLLWRRNAADSQANVYLHTGLGVEDREFRGPATLGTGMVGADLDWETRTLFTAAKYYQFQNSYVAQGRVGFSPKEAPFEELQTWFMLQGMAIGGVQDRLMLTPLVRFFYHNVLWEIGSSTRGEWMLNLMVHY
jgi:hypothetical protein